MLLLMLDNYVKGIRLDIRKSRSIALDGDVVHAERTVSLMVGLDRLTARTPTILIISSSCCRDWFRPIRKFRVAVCSTLNGCSFWLSRLFLNKDAWSVHDVAASILRLELRIRIQSVNQRESIEAAYLKLSWGVLYTTYASGL